MRKITVTRVVRLHFFPMFFVLYYIFSIRLQMQLWRPHWKLGCHYCPWGLTKVLKVSMRDAERSTFPNLAHLKSPQHCKPKWGFSPKQLFCNLQFFPCKFLWQLLSSPHQTWTASPRNPGHLKTFFQRNEGKERNQGNRKCITSGHLESRGKSCLHFPVYCSHL